MIRVLFRNRTNMRYEFEDVDSAIDYVEGELTLHPEDEAVLYCHGLCHHKMAKWDNDRREVLAAEWTPTSPQLLMATIVALPQTELANPEASWGIGA